ncbi:Eukaryotic translation initiation factor 2 alpha kinase 4 [Bulinus truncatus]|nr:Eukaryotic translation initiation factor 2 alpha kinase 4 [Bulinus truncatus]
MSFIYFQFCIGIQLLIGDTRELGAVIVDAWLMCCSPVCRLIDNFRLVQTNVLDKCISYSSCAIITMSSIKSASLMNERTCVLKAKGQRSYRKSQEESSSDSVKFTKASNDCKDLAYPEIVPGKILFIKMECCDGRTLRDAIDEGLYSDMERVWRFFREIVEGLIHIHEKSIIHRDLKPVNIFLDYSDHVKIGDFGLARKSDLFKEATSSALFPRLMLTESSNDSKEGSLTQDVGTSYYVSPEVKTGSQYDEKADIYSLGIIFFEMCYRNFPTGQERAVVLTKLRLSSITLPDDFNNPEKTKEVTIIKHLLRHNPRERPTSREILNAYVSPLPLTVLLEEKVTDLLKCSFANPGSQTYKLFMEAFFNHDMTESQLLFFDNHLYKKMMTPQVSLLYQKLTTNLKKVFIKLGAKIIPLPLFMPKCDVYDDKHVVQLVNKKGGILTLPMDQRVPFARYVGQKQVRYLKRFAIEKVFRENCYTSGATIIFPPSECTECAFDIISPCDSLIPDAEILYAVQEIVNSLNVKMKMGKLKLDVQINHMSILKALLLHYGILEEDHNRVLTALSEEVLFRKAQFFEEFRKEYKITGELLINLLNDLKIKGSKREVKLRLKHLFDSSVAEVRKLAWKAWNDLKLIRSYADHLGFKLQITHFVGLILNPIMYSGIIFQVLDKTLWSHTIALGGRYDNLIEKCSIQGHTGDNKTGGVGISLQLEKLALILAQYEQNLKLCDVVLVIYNEDTSVIKKTLATCKILREIGYQMEIIKVQNNSSLIEEIFRHNICALPEFVLIDAAFPTVKVFSFSPREKCIELHIDKLIIHMRAKRSTRFEYVALM